jgi:RNA polymerase sigma-70 factor (ECF subfamily)
MSLVSDDSRPDMPLVAAGTVNCSPGAPACAVPRAARADVEVDEQDLRAQSRATLGELYERYVDRIYAYLLYRTGSAVEAEDLTARVFVQALNSIERFDERAGSAASWLFTIAHNLLSNYHRTRARRPSAPLEAAATAEDPAAPPIARVEAADDARRVRAAMRRLSAERQHLLLLKYVQNMSNADIGRTIGRNEGAVKSLLRRTLAALRRELEEDGRVTP